MTALRLQHTRARLVVCAGLVFAGCGGASAAPSGAESRTSTAAHDTEQAPSASATACGTDGEPDCPLQRWMKSTLQAYMRKQQYGRVGPAFEELAKLELPDYRKWQSYAEAGQAAAEERDESAVKEACKGCHDAYRAKYRKERRDHAVF